MMHPALVMQNFSRGNGWCGSRSVNVDFDINLADSLTAGRGYNPVCPKCHWVLKIDLLKFNSDTLIWRVIWGKVLALLFL